MDKRLINRVGALTAEIVKESMASGLTWDEAVATLGVAAKAMAARAAREGNGTEADCVALAQQRFQQGMDQSADVLKVWLS